MRVFLESETKTGRTYRENTPRVDAAATAMAAATTAAVAQGAAQGAEEVEQAGGCCTLQTEGCAQKELIIQDHRVRLNMQRHWRSGRCEYGGHT